MSTPNIPKPAKLFMSILYNVSGSKNIEKLLRKLKESYGNIDNISEELHFDYTSYYSSEMGTDLKRIFITFEKLILRDEIIKIKLYINELEKFFQLYNNRNINIDPGMITPENIMLSTNKNFSHRLYLGQGIFGEVTLIYRNKKYKTLEWTFPDYASENILELFLQFRKSYMSQLKAET